MHELASVFFATPEKTRAMWDDFRAEILEEWLLRFPGARPWGWWRYQAPEARRVVEGAGLLRPPTASASPWWDWRQNFGIPEFEPVRPAGSALPLVEAEASYLARHDLLVRGERRRIGAGGFRPRAVNPWATDGVVDPGEDA